MAGLGYKVFTAGEVLTAANVNGYLMEQSVMRFASSGARSSALGTVVSEGMVSYLTDTDALEYYTTTWRTVPALQLANTFTATQTATAFDVNGTAIPANGIYRGATNQLDFSTNSTRRLSIGASGHIAQGASVNTSISFLSSLPMTFSGGNHGIYLNSQASSAVTNIQNVVSIPSLASGAATTYVRHFVVTDNLGTAGTTNEHSGFYANAMTAGTGLIAAFVGNNAPASSRYNLYMGGDASNYIKGRVGIGGTNHGGAKFAVRNDIDATQIGLNITNFAAQTADSIKVINSALSDVFGVTPAGWIKYIAGNTAATAGNLVGYIKIDIGGTEYKVPYYQP